MRITVDLPTLTACALVRKAVFENRPLSMQAEVELARAMERFATEERRAGTRGEVAHGADR